MEQYTPIATEVKKLLDCVKSHDVQNSAACLQLARSAHGALQKSYKVAGNDEEANQAIVSSGVVLAVDAFIEVCRWKAHVQSQTGGEKQPLSDELSAVHNYLLSTLLILASGTDKYNAFCQYALEKSTVECLVGQLSDADVLKQRSKQTSSQQLAEIALHLVMTLHNILYRCQIAADRVDKKRRHTLRHYLIGDNYLLTTMALFASSYLEESDSKVNITDEQAKYLVEWLKACFSGRQNGFKLISTATELLESLCQVVNCSKNCVFMLIKAGILDVLDAILDAPNPPAGGKHDKFVHNVPADPNVLVEFTDETEKSLAVRMLWMAKFKGDTRQELQGRKSTMAALKKLMQSPAQKLARTTKNLMAALASNRSAREEESGAATTVTSARLESASGAKLLAREQQKPAKLVQTAVQPQVRESQDNLMSDFVQSSEDKNDRIFVSYSHKQKDVVQRIVEHLRKQGITNIAIDSAMEANWYEWMMNELEKADLVFVCYSKAYYDSEFCKEEALNAIALKKKIIPLQVENCRPISWLGGIVRIRMWRIFWDEAKFNDSLVSLVQEIRHQLFSSNEKSEEESIAKAQPASSSESAKQPSTAPSAAIKFTQPQSRVREWDEKTTRSWLASVGYPSVSLKIGTLDGKFIEELMHLEQKSPHFLCEMLTKMKGVPIDQAIHILAQLRGLSSSPK